MRHELFEFGTRRQSLDCTGHAGKSRVLQLQIQSSHSDSTPIWLRNSTLPDLVSITLHRPHMHVRTIVKMTAAGARAQLPAAPVSALASPATTCSAAQSRCHNRTGSRSAAVLRASPVSSGMATAGASPSGPAQHQHMQYGAPALSPQHAIQQRRGRLLRPSLRWTSVSLYALAAFFTSTLDSAPACRSMALATLPSVFLFLALISSITRCRCARSLGHTLK